MNFNESPFELPDAIKQDLINALSHLHRYPIGHEETVVREIAAHFGTNPKEVVITHGIDEAIDQIIAQFHGMTFVVFSPCFLGYESRLRAAGLSYRQVPLDDNFAITDADLNKFSQNDFVLLSNPQNPSGVLFDSDTLRILHERCGKLLIDEAYLEYSGQASHLGLFDSNTFVFKSLSKAYSLAGQRIGFLFGEESDIASVRNRQWFCNMDLLSLELIRSVLRRPFAYVHASAVIEQREMLRSEISKLGFYVYPSFSNFLLVRVANSPHFVSYIAQNGIAVLDAAIFGLSNHVRISVANAEQNETLLEAMRNYI